MIKATLVAVLLLLPACAGSASRVQDERPATSRVLVTSNGWHTQIVVASTNLPAHMLPEAADFPDAGWLAFGWGDHVYYPTPDPSPWLALEAVLLPGPAVLHLVPLAGPPRAAPGFEVLEIALSDVALDRLLVALDDAVARDGRPRAEATAPGLHPESRFYPAKGTFHLLRTCNRWVAEQLAAAGLPVRAFGMIRAEALMRQLRGLPMVRVADG